jgi:hypothetical protein
VLRGSVGITNPADPPPTGQLDRRRRRDHLLRLGGCGTITGSILLLVALLQTPYSIRFVYFSFGLAATGVGLTLAILGSEWTLGSIRDARRSTWSLLRAIVDVPHELLIALVGWLGLGLGLLFMGMAIVMPLLPGS